MQIIQTRRDFLASLSAAGAAGLLGARASLADEGPPETTTIRLAYYPASARRPVLVAEELLRAEGFTDVRYVGAGVSPSRDMVARRGRFRHTFAGSSPTWMRRADHGAGGRAFRVLRAVRARADPDHQRAEGQEVGIQEPRLERAPTTWRSWRRMSGSTPRGHRLGHRSDGDRHGAVRRAARSMPFSASRPSRRSCAPARSVA